jgi:hypothetical protein
MANAQKTDAKAVEDGCLSLVLIIAAAVYGIYSLCTWDRPDRPRSEPPPSAQAAQSARAAQARPSLPALPPPTQEDFEWAVWMDIQGNKDFVRFWRGCRFSLGQCNFWPTADQRHPYAGQATVIVSDNHKDSYLDLWFCTDWECTAYYSYDALRGGAYLPENGWVRTGSTDSSDVYRGDQPWLPPEAHVPRPPR